MDDNGRGHSLAYNNYTEIAERSRCNFACQGIDKGSLCMVRGSSKRQASNSKHEAVPFSASLGVRNSECYTESRGATPFLF